MTEPSGPEDMRTLPDLLGPGLALVFVGLNPSEYSAREGHYFANPRNRFWSAFNRSALLPPSLGRECSPKDDAALLEYGIGFTDVAKRPTPQGSGLKAADYRRWAPLLREKLLQWQPRMVCFHGLMAYKAYLRYGEGAPQRRGSAVGDGAERDTAASPELGLQPRAIGHSGVFVVPNPSPANARYSAEALTSWYDEVAATLSRMWEFASPGRGLGIGSGGDGLQAYPSTDPGA